MLSHCVPVSSCRNTAVMRVVHMLRDIVINGAALALPVHHVCPIPRYVLGVRSDTLKHAGAIGVMVR